METRDMCFDVKRLYALALGPVLMLMSLVSNGVWASESERSTVNMTAGVTEVGQQIYDLHMLILWICTIIGALVFGVMFYSIYAHRKSKGAKASSFHESTSVEIAWTVVPLLHLDCHGCACYQDLDRGIQFRRCRPGYYDYWLSVEMEV